MKLKLNPLQKVTAVLAIYALGAILVNLGQDVIYHLLITVGFSLVLFFIFSKLSGKKKNIYNTLISSLIIFLVLHYGTETSELIYPLLATFITIFSKFFLEIKGSPIINPVVFGLLLTYFITLLVPSLEPLFISWWGSSYSYSIAYDTGNYFLDTPIPIALIIVAVWILFFLKTWRKYPTLISFLLLHAAILFIQDFFFSQATGIDKKCDTTFLCFTFTDATIYFFASIMLIEPRTSPILKKGQIVYGTLAALTYNLIRYLGYAHFDLIAIAIANLYFFISKKLKAKKS